MLTLAFIIHKPVLIQRYLVEVNGGNQAAKEPTGGIAHGNGDDFVADTGHDKQINLSENNKGRKHDHSRCLAVTGSAKSAGVNLIETAEQIERSQPAKQQSTIFDNLRLLIEEGDNGCREDHQGNHDDDDRNHTQNQRFPYTFLARSTWFLPRFCPTKVVEAIPMDCMGRKINASTLE